MADQSPTRKIGRFLAAARSTGDRWLVTNTRRELLGEIEKERRWRQHVFAPAPGAVFSEECLGPLAEFLRELDQAAETLRRRRGNG